MTDDDFRAIYAALPNDVEPAEMAAILFAVLTTYNFGASLNNLIAEKLLHEVNEFARHPERFETVSLRTH